MKYYIYIKDKKYLLGIPKDGEVELHIDNNQKDEIKKINICEIKEINAISSDKEERLISKQQWLLEIDAMDSSNEWASNSLFVYSFFCISPLLINLFFIYLGFFEIVWIPIFNAISIFFGYISYKKFIEKKFLIFSILGFISMVVYFSNLV